MSNRTYIAKTQKDTVPQLKFSNLEIAIVSESETVQKWLGYAEVYGIWRAPEQNLVEIGRKRGRWMEMLLPGVGCPGGRPDVRVGPDVRA